MNRLTILKRALFGLTLAAGVAASGAASAAYVYVENPEAVFDNGNIWVTTDKVHIDGASGQEVWMNLTMVDRTSGQLLGYAATNLMAVGSDFADGPAATLQVPSAGAGSTQVVYYLEAWSRPPGDADQSHWTKTNYIPVGAATIAQDQITETGLFSTFLATGKTFAVTHGDQSDAVRDELAFTYYSNYMSTGNECLGLEARTIYVGQSATGMDKYLGCASMQGDPSNGTMDYFAKYYCPHEQNGGCVEKNEQVYSGGPYQLLSVPQPEGIHLRLGNATFLNPMIYGGTIGDFTRVSMN